MSNQVNDNLLERAEEVMVYFEGTSLETAIQNNIENNNLDIVRELIVNAEAEMAREMFYAEDTH